LVCSLGVQVVCCVEGNKDYWVRKKIYRNSGFVFGSLHVTSRRGLAASRHLEQGDLILRVPKSALMSVLTARAVPQLAVGMTVNPTLSSTQVSPSSMSFLLDLVTGLGMLVEKHNMKACMG
jgi:hypothetical protein